MFFFISGTDINIPEGINRSPLLGRDNVTTHKHLTYDRYQSH